ncbi:hypothetical protein [Thiothrix winogradskyi]|uniref:Uncharacterized protein n=1 Tax=Thiothrix winogradskyi TaxID=96472 RepID=A0ABY3SU97_9GAMM|nr:hypothetical protein [Thiothrix winogradskyi]UJS22981.1 hypothetical protein L2Y54_13635 [Thiothrix winogradskyi]
MEPFVAKQPMADESRPTEKLFTGLAVNHVNPSAIKQWLAASNSRYPSVIRASQTCEGFDFYGHNHTLQALKACPNTA